MSLVDQSSWISSPPRHIPSRVRLCPKFVSEFCSSLVNDQASCETGTRAAGLLFGTVEEDVVNVQALKPLAAGTPNENGPLTREWLDGAFQQARVKAKANPKLISLQMVGWYCVREGGEGALSESELEFHRRHFRRASDVALIFKPDEHLALSIELYGSSLNTGISGQCCGRGSLHLDSEVPASEPIDLEMGQGIEGDSNFRVLGVLDPVDRIQRRGRWKEIALSAWKIAPFISVDSRRPRTFLRLAFSMSQTKLLWVSSAVVFVLSAGLTFGWCYAREPQSSIRGNTPDRASGSTRLGLRVEPRGDSLLVTWNRGAVQPVRKGLLQIEDGSQERRLHLDPSQIANGSVVYTPTSKNLMFRLEVSDSKGSTIAENLLVGDRTNSAPIVQSVRPRISKAERPPKLAQSLAAPHSVGSVAEKASPSSNAPAGLRPTQYLPSVKSLVTAPQPAEFKKSGKESFSPYLPARPLKQVAPNVTTLWPSSRSGSTDVEVEVRIDPEGRVTDARVVNSGSKDNGPYANAAVAAARQWIFEPAKMKGQNVPNSHIIAFHFRPQVGQQ